MSHTRYPHDIVIYFREGAFDVGTEFTDELFELRIPDDMDVYTCDIGTFTIWCRRFTQFFTTLRFNTDLFVSARIAKLSN